MGRALADGARRRVHARSRRRRLDFDRDRRAPSRKRRGARLVPTTHSLRVLVGEAVVLGRLLGRLLLEGVEVAALALGGVELALELADALAELLALAGGRAALGGLGREGVELLLGVDEVEEDVEDARENEREEERGAREVDWGLVMRCRRRNVRYSATQASTWKKVGRVAS